MRVRTAALSAAIVAAVGTVGVAPHAAATIASTHYTVTRDFDYYSQTTKVIRWNPCHAISYRINPGGSRITHRISLVRTAIAKLSAASGLTFTYLGRTSYLPRAATLHAPSGDFTMLEAAQQYRKTGARLVVAWAARTGSGSSNLLLQIPSYDAGIGMVSWASSMTARVRALEAAVVLKKGVPFTLTGFQAGGSEGALVLHELGHAMALQHYSDTHQIMNPYLSAASPGDYAAGDMAGLAKVGRPAGCISTKPAPIPDPIAYANQMGWPVTA